MNSPKTTPGSYSKKEGKALSQSFIASGILAFCVISVLIGILNPFISSLIKPTAPSKKTEKSALFSSIRDSMSDRLVYIDLQGMISEEPVENVFSDDVSAMGVYKKLHEALEDNSVKGVLLHINSPGGTVGMSQELYQAVLKLRAKKPVVVSMGDLAASGGYYTAAAADKIVANSGTLTASIGVILHSMTMEELLTKKLGVKPVTIKSGKFKDILSPYRSPTSEDRDLLQDMINKSYHQFLADVIYGRTLSIDKDDTEAREKIAKSITTVADGRVVLGSDAIHYGLIDKVGTTDDAKTVLKELVAKRFPNVNTKKIEFDSAYGRGDFWSLFESSGQVNLRATLKSIVAPSASEWGNWKPLTIRYANQPLWLMESVN